MGNDIKTLVSKYKRKYNTSDPFLLARELNVLVHIGNIGIKGGYMYLKRHKYIFLSQDLEEHEMRLVLAHELGHAVLHPRTNCNFLKSFTLILTDKIEREANEFAAELLISDEELKECRDYTLEQLSRYFGYSEKFIKLKFQNESNQKAYDFQ